MCRSSAALPVAALAKIEEARRREEARRSGLDLSGTEWERWFGDPWKAAESIEAIGDYYESILDEIQGRGMSGARGFAAMVSSGGPCPWGLCHTGSLSAWLESPVLGPAAEKGERECT